MYRGWLGTKLMGLLCLPPLINLSNCHFAEVEREPQGEVTGPRAAGQEEGADAEAPHPASPMVPSIIWRGSNRPQAQTFWFCLQPIWAQEATGGKLASLEAAVSPRPPGLVAAGLLVEW